MKKKIKKRPEQILPLVPLSERLKKKKTFIKSNTDSSLLHKSKFQGFEDFAESIEDDKKISRNNQKFDNHHVLNFLEKEIPRIKKIDFLYSQALPNLHKHPVLERSIEAQEEEKNKLKEVVLELISDDNSCFYKFLKVCFENFFPPQKKG